LAEVIPRQIIFVAIGFVVMIVTALIDYKYWASLTRYMYIFAIGSLIVIFAIAQVTFGAARWLEVGLINIQPSELAKIIMILVLADFFAKNQDQPHDIRWIMKSLVLTGGVVIWIILQPNLSTSIVILVIWFSLIWASGLKPKHLLIFVIVGLMLMTLFFFVGMEDYQKARILQFAFPDPDARYGNTYNVDQALITIGSGGLAGQGYGQSTQVQLRFLKVRHTDFIFSVLAAEFGFVGTSIVVGMIIFVILRCFRVARLASDQFGALIAFGFGVLIFFQTAVNIGVNLNVIPVTGLTLPFVSYGGSSILSLVLGIGLVESVAAHQRT
ncbi:MAG: rod shape-determining protein RodA, partial [Anaerolineaceae bacterium]|nr:rod shape-determining protein RodA [Anaerolineaceae bacterium]